MKPRLWVILSLILHVSCNRNPFTGTRPTLKGMALTIENVMSPDQVQKNLMEIKNIGANATFFKISEIQDDWKASTIYPNPEQTLALEKLYFVLKEAKSLGLQTALMPILLLRNTAKRTEWRGMIRPENLSGWWNSYRGMILKYAEIAQEQHVDFFAVGSELVSMEFYSDAWKDLIQEVRKKYSGKIFYSSNWDYLSIAPAWKGLDFLGLNAYYELTKKGETPNTDELKLRWDKIRKTAEKWGSDFGKEILITEVGYPSREDGLSDPWDHTKMGKVNQEIQVQGYEAFLRSWSKSPLFMGAFFYEWAGEGGSQDPGYTPRGKPALKVLQKWMQQN